MRTPAALAVLAASACRARVSAARALTARPPVRAVQAERTLGETRRAREAETQAAAFAERARIARDLHDVLAHSLAAVSVNLQAAEGLLTSGTLPADNPELVKAIECIERAGTLTRDGLAAAKRAVLSLRDDVAPLPDQLALLAERYRTAGEPAVNVEVSGEARPITLPGITVIGQAEDGAAAVETVAATHPQVVLMDLNMPRCDGVEATRRIRAEEPGTQVVVLTTYSDDESIIGALQAGALGYLTKDATRAEIGRAVLAAAAGQAVLDPAVQQRLLSAAVRAPAAQPDHDPDELTPRESDVLRLIAAGKSNREIARALYVSEATVKTHVNRIFAKTGSRDRAQAIRYAYTHGYADPARSG